MIRTIVAIGASCALIASACAADEKGSEMTAAALRTSLAETLPIGSTTEQVIGHLDSKGYEHSGYVKAERRIDAIQRDTDGSKLVSRSLAMRFDFGTDDRLQAIDVREVFTGP